MTGVRISDVLKSIDWDHARQVCVAFCLPFPLLPFSSYLSHIFMISLGLAGRNGGQHM